MKKPQDGEREELLRKLFELIPTNGNRIGTDAADEFGRGYELKTTTKSGVSTARDVGHNHLKKWRKVNWICGKGSYRGKEFIFDEIYFLYPHNLEEWFQRIEKKLTERDELFTLVLELMNRNLYNEEAMDTVRKTFARGVLLNDPNIPWSYIQTYGHRIESDHPSALRKLVASQPEFPVEGGHDHDLFDEEMNWEDDTTSTSNQ